MSLKDKRRSNRNKKTKIARTPFKGLSTGQSYSIIGKSDFLVNLILGHIVSMNMEDNWDFESSIYGKYMEVSDTVEPIANEKIVFSYIERTDFPVIDIDEDFLKIFYYLLLNGEDCEEYFEYCKKHLSRKPPELAFYFMFAMMEIAVNDDLEFSYKKAEYILNHYKYKGTHTYMEKMKAIVTFVKNPSEKHLSELLLIMNEEEEPYSSLVNVIGAIANDSLPKFVKDKYGNTLEDMNFQKNLLKIAMAILQSEHIEDFILSLVKGIVYA